ncbi:hypothetical protein ONS95_005694 [Cadophora gregata]|uniref:uncharacterized protein n=1 Tax=Cadophora gregata TaxID=51156 RepID=UPI0026DC610C|nr:uncharacterized protein ONS95_005694 [Cadophora gregata]KAK0103684.1 hypothetical protein ONS95_005694 [Cadophora gregata]KAK0107874.1 hypothetical protein ONS96_003663 [Cadophora gregata f. sp. sojae]
MAATDDSKAPNEKATKIDSRQDEHIEAALKPDEFTADAAAKGQARTGYETISLWDTVKTFKIATGCCFAAAFSAGADGYQMAMNASIIANKGFVQQFATSMDKNGKLFLESGTISSWSATQNCGQVLGQTGIAFVNGRFGRKIGMYVLWTLIMVSVLVETFARNWKVWLVAKLFAGMGVGAMQATILGYISEVAPVRVRGSMLMLYSFWWTLGSFCTHVALQRLNRRDAYDYLTPIYTQWAHVGIMAIIYVCLPESPAWCASVGKEEKAKKYLKLIHRDVKDYDVEYQYQVMALNIEHERAIAAEQRNESWVAIFKGVDGRRTITALWAIVSQQFLGLALFGTFGTYFFQQAGLADPFKIKAITSSLQIVTVLSAVILVDKFGRRLMACCSTTLMWIACLVVGILGVAPESNATTYIFVLFACFWNIGIAGNGAAGWGYIGEISSQRLRPYTSGFAASANSISGLIMSVLTPYMVNAHKWNWRYKTGFFYAGVGAIWVVGSWLIIPETAGRSAAELDELFERKIKAWRFKKTETATQRLVKSEQEEIERS